MLNDFKVIQTDPTMYFNLVIPLGRDHIIWPLSCPHKHLGRDVLERPWALDAGAGLGVIPSTDCVRWTGVWNSNCRRTIKAVTCHRGDTSDGKASPCLALNWHVDFRFLKFTSGILRTLCAGGLTVSVHQMHRGTALVSTAQCGGKIRKQCWVHFLAQTKWVFRHMVVTLLQGPVRLFEGSIPVIGTEIWVWKRNLGRGNQK